MLRHDHFFLRHLIHEYPLTVAYAALAMWVTLVVVILEAR